MKCVVLFLVVCVFAATNIKTTTASCNDTSLELSTKIRTLQFRLYNVLQSETGLVGRSVFQTECNEKECVNCEGNCPMCNGRKPKTGK